MAEHDTITRPELSSALKRLGMPHDQEAVSYWIERLSLVSPSPLDCKGIDALLTRIGELVDLSSPCEAMQELTALAHSPVCDPAHIKRVAQQASEAILRLRRDIVEVLIPIEAMLLSGSDSLHCQAMRSELRKSSEIGLSALSD